MMKYSEGFKSFLIIKSHTILYLTPSVGALAPLVPGQLKGLWEMWKDHGRLPWRDLIQPTIDLANKGIQFNEAIRSSLHFVSYKLKRMKLDNDFL